MYLVHTPQYLQTLLPGLTWKMADDHKVLYLTFDDGPIPEITPWVLDTLQEFDAHATFFCVGDNIRKYPEIFQMVIDAGHTVGNHTFNHLSGWATANISYFHNIRHCARLVESGLFRPPYGRIKPSQAHFLRRHYRIVMWDVLSGDFDKAIEPEECYRNVVENAGPGSIVVFHDSLKAEKNLRYALPKVLEHFAEMGYTFHAVPKFTPDIQNQKAVRLAV
jgi:peptidoglycan/xylan/chitin deacetylase (PgdA/CDA1 family)